MATRTTFTGASTEVPWPNTPEAPEGFGDQYARHVKTLYDGSALPLAAIGGTADDVTATLDPELDGDGLLDGMKFTLTWAADNTGPMTLAINGGSPVPILDAAGGTMIAGAARSGTRALLEYIAGAFRALAGGGMGGGARSYHVQIDASTTWTKPQGFDDDTMFTVCAWAGGGGGGSNAAAGGGGGGAYAERRVRYADLPPSLTVTIGAGGAVAGAGGNTSVGSVLVAYGGNAGSSIGNGGGGGGMISAGSGSNGGLMGGGTGGASGAPGLIAALPYGGGGGGGNQGNGGAAYLGGGGGGGGSTATLGGTSTLGGSGGNNGVAGAIPGGGGGRNAAGGRGRVIIYV